MKRYDAIVAGAGPAGSAAALTLAREGASVLMLERARFPRDKPCGGGVTLRAAACQDIDLGPVIERTVSGARFSLRLGPAFDRRYEQPLTYMTQRSRLDAHLAEAAAGAGVTAAVIGRTGGTSLTVAGRDPISISTLREAHEGWLPDYMAAP